MGLKIFSFLLLASLMDTTFVTGQLPLSRIEPLDHVCLGCLCEALSLCNREIGCLGNVCGIFKISWSYWVDSGRPTLHGAVQANANNHEEYEKCANDPVCAAITVRNYMSRFSQDCNGDGLIDCMDYAAIHMLGGYNCTVPLNQYYLGALINCHMMVQLLSGDSGARNLI